MATRTYSFFGTRKEVLDILLPTIQEQGLFVLRDGGGVEPNKFVNPPDLRQLNLGEPGRLWVSRHRPPDEALYQVPTMPARWGWVGLDLPQEVGRSLLMGEMAASNVWSDGELDHRSDESFVLFKQLHRIVKQKAAGSVKARSLINGAVRDARNIALLKSSRDWVAGGGELRQEFVKNVVFEPV